MVVRSIVVLQLSYSIFWRNVRVIVQLLLDKRRRRWIFPQVPSPWGISILQICSSYCLSLDWVPLSLLIAVTRIDYTVKFFSNFSLNNNPMLENFDFQEFFKYQCWMILKMHFTAISLWAPRKSPFMAISGSFSTISRCHNNTLLNCIIIFLFILILLDVQRYPLSCFSMNQKYCYFKALIISFNIIKIKMTFRCIVVKNY